MTPTELQELCTALNGDNPIDPTLLSSLLTTGKTILEGERDWMNLRKTDTSITVPANSSTGWNTPISMAGISDFLRFYWDEGKGSYPIRLFDGQNRIEYYRQVPFSRRLEYKDVSNTFTYDPINKILYFNGIVNFTATAYINYIVDTGDIDIPAESDDVEEDIKTSGIFPFPKRFHPVLAYYAVGINKGAIDYDDIVKMMLSSNAATLQAIKNAMENWDTNVQLTEQMDTDPSGGDLPAFRPNAVNMSRPGSL